jgi:hypothetical protein
MKKILLTLGFLILALAAVGAALVGPRNILGMIRYDRRRDGNLKVGDRAPDVELIGLDGSARRLSSAIGSRPAVLIFGSYT